MENELISNVLENKIIDDLKKIIDNKKARKINLSHYVKNDMGACMDFAMLYEAFSDLRYFIDTQREKGVEIRVNEDSIEVLQ